MDEPRDSKPNRRRMATLRRRRAFLQSRLLTPEGNSHDKAEHAALEWVIQIAEDWMDSQDQNEARRERAERITK